MPRERERVPSCFEIWYKRKMPILEISEPRADVRSAPAAILTRRFDEAVVWANELHREQKRKGSTVPYVAHVLAVAAIVLEHGGGEDEAIAALLHDAAEDCGGRRTHEEIERRFGPRVAQIVDGCTDSYESRKPAWRPRKEAHVARLREADASVRLVAAADKLHNARSVLADLREEGERVWDRFAAPRHETLWYYRAAAGALSLQEADGRLRVLLDELRRVVGDLERMAADSIR
jgi:(p)ppGpp synthase/HD superfamily hydrolase